MAIRPEATTLRASSRAFMNKVISNPDVGLKSARKDFLEKTTIGQFNKTNKVSKCHNRVLDFVLFV